MTGHFTGDDTAGTAFAEFDELQHFRDLGQFGTDLFQCAARSQFAAVIDAVKMFDDRDGFGIKTGSLESDFVDHFDTAVASFGHHERRNVFGVGGKSGNNGETADPAELVDRHQTGKDHIICDFSVSAGNSAVDIDDMVAYFAVMGDMAGGHEQAVAADDGLGSGLGAAVYGGAFPENIAVADFDIGGSTRFNCVILSGLSDGGKGMQGIVFADGGIAIDVALGDKSGTGTDFHIWSDIAERSDFHAFSENGTVHDNAGRMNRRHNFFLTFKIVYFYRKNLSFVYYIIKKRLRQAVLLVKNDLLHYFIIMTKQEDRIFRVTLVLDRLRSAHNTGNIFRIAEALGADIAACGYTPCPPHPKLEKTAMGADKMVACRHFESSLEAIECLRREGVKMILAAEPGGSGAWEMEYEFPLAIVLGNEALGVAAETLEKVDGTVSLPMLGEKASINVGNAAAAIMYAVAAKCGITK